MKKWKIILSLCFFPLLLQGCNLQDNTDSVPSTNNGSPYLVSKYEYQETKTINFKNKVKETQKNYANQYTRFFRRYVAS